MGRLRSLVQRSRSYALLGAALCLHAGSVRGAAQQPTFDLELRGQGFRRLSLQMMDPRIDPSASRDRDPVLEGRETLARDLIFSGLFYVTDSDGRPFLPRGVSRVWNLAEDSAGDRPRRLESEWREENGTITVDLRVLDASGAQLLGKRYQIGSAGTRPAMHHFADQVVKQLTGLPGIAQTKIAYARMVGKSSEIYVVDYDGFGAEALTKQRALSLSPCWGTAREWIAFTSYVEGQPFLYRLDQGSHRMRCISRYPGLNTTPDWCPSRRAFALTLTRDGNAEIYSMGPEGQSPKRLTYNPAIDTSPSWSATGQQIAFTSDRSGVPQIYVMDADGGNVRRVTQNGQYCDSAAWSPDGQWIAYVCRRDGEFQLVVVRPDGTDERVVVRGGSNDSPSWANDSRHLAFSSRREGTRGLYVVDLYSGLERRLDADYQEEITPAWSRE